MHDDGDMRSWSLIAQMQFASTLILSTVFSKQHSDNIPLCIIACCRLTEACACHMHHVRMRCYFKQTNKALLSCQQAKVVSIKL